jgi:KDO2-lipid IV(A) lauroyltransferase
VWNDWNTGTCSEKFLSRFRSILPPWPRLLLNLYTDRILGRVVKAIFWVLRLTNPDRSSDFCGWVTRHVGPWLPAHRIGQENLRAAFPDKDAAWIEATLRESWENLGRVVGEYVHMARIWDYDIDHPNAGRIVTDAAPMFEMLRDDGKPALCFAAHLANWELPAIAAAQQQGCCTGN